jgi:hypothetical protein
MDGGKSQAFLHIQQEFDQFLLKISLQNQAKLCSVQLKA